MKMKKLYTVSLFMLGLAVACLAFSFVICPARVRQDALGRVEVTMTEKNAAWKGGAYVITFGLLIENNSKYELDEWEGTITVKNKEGKELLRSDLSYSVPLSSSYIPVGESRAVETSFRYASIDENAQELYSTAQEDLVMTVETTGLTVVDDGYKSVDKSIPVIAAVSGEIFIVCLILGGATLVVFGLILPIVTGKFKGSVKKN